MGNCCGYFPRFRAVPVRRKIVLLLVGLDNSGKTTAAKGLSGDFVESTVPTVGFSVVKLASRGYDVLIYDLGGGPQIRAIWNSYFHDVHGLIFVVDASDRSRLEESRTILETLLRDDKLSGKPVLLLANKQDKSEALDEIDIVEKLRLEPLVNKHKCPTLVEVCTALPTASSSRSQMLDRRLLRGYRWLIKQVIHNYTFLNNRVEKDVKVELERMTILREKLKKRQELEETERQKAEENTPEHTNGDVHKNGDAHINGDLANREGTSVLGNGEPPGITGSDISGIPGVSNKKSGLRSILEKKGELQQKLARSNKNWKNNKVHPGGESLEKTFRPVVLPGSNGPLFEFGSMTFRALTTPVRDRNRLNNQSKQNIRPTTSKSLSNEVGPWGLERELKIVEPPND